MRIRSLYARVTMGQRGSATDVGSAVVGCEIETVTVFQRLHGTLQTPRYGPYRATIDGMVQHPNCN